MFNLLADLRYILRQLRRSPGFVLLLRHLTVALAGLLSAALPARRPLGAEPAPAA